jgi:hypothetical protein
MAAGTTMPPTAAAIGRTAWRGSPSSPWTISRFTSRPMTKKKIAIRPSLIQCASEWRIWKEPISNPTGVFQSARNSSEKPELASARAVTVATSRTTPLADSTCMKRSIGSVRRAIG